MSIDGGVSGQQGSQQIRQTNQYSNTGPQSGVGFEDILSELLDEAIDGKNDKKKLEKLSSQLQNAELNVSHPHYYQKLAEESAVNNAQAGYEGEAIRRLNL